VFFTRFVYLYCFCMILVVIICSYFLNADTIIDRHLTLKIGENVNNMFILDIWEILGPKPYLIMSFKKWNGR